MLPAVDLYIKQNSSLGQSKNCPSPNTQLLEKLSKDSKGIQRIQRIILTV